MELKKINQLKAGVILNYISMGLGYLISILYTPIMLRILGQSEYGLYNLVAAIVSYLGLLNFGFGSAYMRYYSRYKAKEDNDNIAKLNGMFFIIFTIIGFISVLAGIALVINSALVLGNQLTESELSTARILMIIMVINLAISFPNIIFNTYISANEKFIFQKIIQLIKIVINPFLILPVLFLGYGSIGMVIMTTSLSIIIEIANIYYCYNSLHIKFSFKNFDMSLMKEMIVFSSFIFLNMIIDQINWNVDKFILGRFRGTVSVAIYGLASQLNMYYITLSTSISNVFIPRIHSIVSSSDDNNILTNLFAKVGRIQFMFLMLILSGLAIFGKDFINIWAGSEYVESYYIVLILIISETIPLIQNIGIEIQKAKNIHQFRSILYFVIAIGNLFISIPLAREFGGVGAAIGTAIAQIIGNNIIMNFYYHKRVGVNMKYFWKEIIKLMPALIIPIIYGGIILFFFNTSKIIWFLVFGTSYVVVYALSIWIFGMNQNEKALIEKPVKRVLGYANKI